MSRTVDDSPRRPNFPLRLALMLVAVLVIFGGVFGIKYVIGKKTNEFFDTMQQPPATVSSFVAKGERWSGGAEAVGSFTAVNGTDVTTEAGGVVRAIHFTAGQPVKAGTVLVELNTANELATLKSLQAASNLARVQSERWQKLGQDQLVSKDEVQQRVTSAATAQAQVDAQRALIAQKTIRAPFSGILGIRKINLGQFVSPGSAIVSLQQLDPIYLDFALPEQQLPLLRDGMTVRATVDAMPGRSFEGKITAIEPAVDPDTRNFSAQATFDNADSALRPGSFAHVSFDTGTQQDVVVVPQTAISFNPYGNAVFVIEKGKNDPNAKGPDGKPVGPTLVVKQRFVETGATRGNLIAVTKGLKAGEQVATSGLLKLRNDAVVTINNSVQPDASAQPQQVQNR